MFHSLSKSSPTFICPHHRLVCRPVCKQRGDMFALVTQYFPLPRSSCFLPTIKSHYEKLGKVFCSMLIRNINHVAREESLRWGVKGEEINVEEMLQEARSTNGPHERSTGLAGLHAHGWWQTWGTRCLARNADWFSLQSPLNIFPTSSAYIQRRSLVDVIPFFWVKYQTGNTTEAKSWIDDSSIRLPPEWKYLQPYFFLLPHLIHTMTLNGFV